MCVLRYFWQQLQVKAKRISCISSPTAPLTVYAYTSISNLIFIL